MQEKNSTPRQENTDMNSDLQNNEQQSSSSLDDEIQATQQQTLEQLLLTERMERILTQYGPKASS